jgi:hypothetical protein
MIKIYTVILNSPFGYKYKCVFIYNYIRETNNKINGTFYIGNPKTKVEDACITLSVFFPSNDSFIDTSIASLILVKYYETCSENKKLIQGEGTIDMMITAMSFVKQVCPFIKEFKLNDASIKKCDNGTNISLPYFYITQTNKTWYEGRFGAYLKEPIYTSYKKDISRIMKSTLPDFNTFVINHIAHTNTSKMIIDELHSVYVEGQPLRLFFNALYNKYDKSMGCILLSTWIDKFMSNTGLQKYMLMADWFISADNIQRITYTLNSEYIL